MPYVPFHTHTFEIPTASTGQIVEGLRDDLSITPLAIKPILDAITAGSQMPPAIRIVTAAGPVTLLANDDIVIIDKTVGEVTPVNLGLSADRGGKTAVFKDGNGDADIFPITPVTSGGELIDGLDPAVWAIVTPNGSLKIHPIPGGWITIP